MNAACPSFSKFAKECYSAWLFYYIYIRTDWSMEQSTCRICIRICNRSWTYGSTTMVYMLFYFFWVTFTFAYCVQLRFHLCNVDANANANDECKWGGTGVVLLLGGMRYSVAALCVLFSSPIKYLHSDQSLHAANHFAVFAVCICMNASNFMWLIFFIASAFIDFAVFAVRIRMNASNSMWLILLSHPHSSFTFALPTLGILGYHTYEILALEYIVYK